MLFVLIMMIMMIFVMFLMMHMHRNMNLLVNGHMLNNFLVNGHMLDHFDLLDHWYFFNMMMMYGMDFVWYMNGMMFAVKETKKMDNVEKCRNTRCYCINSKVNHIKV